jgi:hypothetical protein
LKAAVAAFFMPPTAYTDILLEQPAESATDIVVTIKRESTCIRHREIGAGDAANGPKAAAASDPGTYGKSFNRIAPIPTVSWLKEASECSRLDLRRNFNTLFLLNFKYHLAQLGPA